MDMSKRSSDQRRLSKGGLQPQKVNQPGSSPREQRRASRTGLEPQKLSKGSSPGEQRRQSRAGLEQERDSREHRRLSRSGLEPQKPRRGSSPSPSEQRRLSRGGYNEQEKESEQQRTNKESQEKHKTSDNLLGVSCMERKGSGRGSRRGSRRGSKARKSIANVYDGLPYAASFWVQESDGSFFESFTALAWKQENRRLRLASEDEKQADEPPPSESHLGPRLKVHHLQKKEFELLYIEVLYTIKHKIGATSGSHLPFIQDLYLYAREAFGVTPEDHAFLMAKASEEKPPILVLDLTVSEARDLEAKDANGFSDPYCMLGIMPGNRSGSQGGTPFSSDDEGKPRREEKRSTLKKFSQSFKRRRDKKDTARDLLPAKYIRTTTVKPNTLNPVWQERFRIDLEDINTDVCHLDIWDHDDEFSVKDAAKRLNEVQGIKGLGRYFKQIAQSARSSSKGNIDDFLGCVNISLKDIPSTGIDKWFDLEGRSSRSNVEGQLRLRLNLATREDRGISEEDNWTDIKQHEDLLCIFIEHELRQYEDEIYTWNGELPQAALTILHQHAIQGDITEVQQSMCYWMAFSRKHMEHPFDWELLLRLLDRLDDVFTAGSLSRDEEESLAESFNLFIEYCLGLIKKQRDIYPPANKAAYHRLQTMLRCLARIYSCNVFKRCCPFQKELYSEIHAVLKKSTLEWYERMHTATRPHSTSDEDTIQSLVELTNTLNSDMQIAVQYYNQLYQESIPGVNYFTAIYRQLEKLLGDDVFKDLDNLAYSRGESDDELCGSGPQQMSTQLFELYLALQEFCRFKDHLTPSEVRNLSVTQYYEWFRVPVHRWLTVSRHKALQRIRKAVELDKVGQVDGDVKQSTSAVDVCCCFGQIVEFWKNLDWPDKAGALPFVSKITEDLSDGAKCYADLMHEKLKSAGYYDEVGQFDVTEQLCITINDIEQVRRALRPLPEVLKYSEIIEAQNHGGSSYKHARGKLYGILKGADEETVQKIKQVVDRVADKMRPDIKKDVFHLCWSPESVPAEDAISDLMNYLDSNLLTLNNNLLRANFDRILDSIWVEVLEELMEVLTTEEESRSTAFFERLYESLDILVDFFHANQKGLPMDKIKSKQYRDVERFLGLNKAETKHLVEMYFMEKVEEQDSLSSTEFGTLSVRVYYNLDAEILCVEVLNAKNIIPLDANGLSDPFVLIEMCPQHVFPKQTVQKTRIVKKTLHPVFDESFEFCVTVEQCRHEGATVLFTVMDHDFMLANDFAGEAYLNLNAIPGISGEDVSGFTALTPVNLALTQPKRGKGESLAKGVLNALELREADKEAQEFVKKRRYVESQAQ